LLGAVLGLGAIEVACKPPPPTTANVKAGDLPAAGDWSGVFYSPLYGHLHLVHQGNVVSGKWRTTNGDKWDENANHEIKGEWGLDASEIGNPWQAVRQRNMLPDPNSVQPDETERVNMPDEWDSAPKSKAGAPGAEPEGAGEGADGAKGDKPE
jgi:hypothetical protein